MHSCPECGQACYCNGDIDDCKVTEAYVHDHCTHYKSKDCNEWFDHDQDCRDDDAAQREQKDAPV